VVKNAAGVNTLNGIAPSALTWFPLLGRGTLTLWNMEDGFSTIFLDLIDDFLTIRISSRTD